MSNGDKYGHWIATGSSTTTGNSITVTSTPNGNNYQYMTCDDDGTILVYTTDGTGGLTTCSNMPRTENVYQSPDYEGESLTGPEDKICTKCKETVPDHKVAASYGYRKIAKHVCHKCYIKQLDKQFGIEESVDIEDVLYGEKEEN